MTAAFYKLNVGQIPNELYHPSVPSERWLSLCETSENKETGFPPDSLNTIDPIPLDVELERIVGISLWMLGNILPFLLPPLLLASIAGPPVARFLAGCVFGYAAILTLIEFGIFRPRFRRKYRPKGEAETGNDQLLPTATSKALATKIMDVRSAQYVFTERNTMKYLSMKFVWPKALHRPAMESTPVIFAVVPHGVAPLGITAYPLWSKLWNDKVCRWTAAPVVLKIPVVKRFFAAIGYIPAKSQSILDALTKREENVGIALDGIAGMFHQNDRSKETAFLRRRKGIVKIALRAGVPLVPVYGFGHTSMWTVVVDPLGALEKLSNLLEASLVPFFGRFMWFLGPPRRTPVTVCLGEPVLCPRVDDPTQEQIDLYHEKLLDGYRKIFDMHKAAYGWDNKQLTIV